MTGQVNLTSILGSHLVNEGRMAFLDGDPVTRWEAQTLSTAYTRAGSVPFTIGQSRLTDTFSRQAQLSDTLSWSHDKHTVRIGGSVARHMSGGQGNEPGFAVLGTFTFLNTTTKPFDQLTLADVQNYSQPISYGITTYNLNQWLIAGFAQDSIRVNNDLTIDAGLRYDVQTLTRREKRLRAARRLRLASERRFAPGGSRRLRHVLHADSIQPDRGLVDQRAGRIHDLHGDAGAARLPDLLDGIVSAAVVRSEDAARVGIARPQHHAPGRPGGLLPDAVRDSTG